nr:immunoglobulin light chain junction region [Macaca mulatta]
CGAWDNSLSAHWIF